MLPPTQSKGHNRRCKSPVNSLKWFGVSAGWRGSVVKALVQEDPQDWGTRRGNTRIEAYERKTVWNSDRRMPLDCIAVKVLVLSSRILRLNASTGLGQTDLKRASDHVTDRSQEGQCNH